MSAKLHAVYSASGSDRWLSCPGSIDLSRDVPEQKISPYAAEGTRAHEVLEIFLKHRTKRGTERGKAAIAARKIGADTGMIVHAEMALDYIEDLLKQRPDAELLVEQKIELPVSEPGQFGTADVVIADHFGRLIVIDYKYGAGVPVSAGDQDGPNTQLVYYALGVAHRFDYNFASVELVVIQPRAAIDGKYIRSHKMTVEELIEWRGTFEKGIQASKKSKPILKSGDHCRWCPAAYKCPELKQHSFKQAQIQFQEDFVEDQDEGQALTLPDPKIWLNENHLSLALNATDRIETWIEAVRSHAFQRLSAGLPVPGFKLVEKRGTRKWNDVKETNSAAFAKFGQLAFTEPELLSPAQLEKLRTCKVNQRAAEKFVAEHSTNVSSGMKLARDTDSRPATSRAKQDFLEEGEIDDEVLTIKKTKKKKR